MESIGKQVSQLLLPPRTATSQQQVFVFAMPATHMISELTATLANVSPSHRREIPRECCQDPASALAARALHAAAGAAAKEVHLSHL